MELIGQGGYQEAYLHEDLVIKIAGSATSEEALKIKNYHQEIKSIGVKVPKYFGYGFAGNKLISFWEFTGQPLKNAFLELKAEDINKIVKLIIRQIKKSSQKNIAFYPKVDQFTYRSGNIYFVDFYPTRLQEDFDNYSDDKKIALHDRLYDDKFRINKLIDEVANIRPDLRDLLQEIACQH